MALLVGVVVQDVQQAMASKLWHILKLLDILKHLALTSLMWRDKSGCVCGHRAVERALQTQQMSRPEVMVCCSCLPSWAPAVQIL